MSLSLEDYCAENQKRTLSSIKKCSKLPKSRPPKDRLGVCLEPEKIVLDELHLLLRIGDVLIRNLVTEMVLADKKTKRIAGRGAQLASTNLDQLQLFVNTHCKVTFRVWEKRNPDGRPSGLYDSTSLMGSDMKKVLRLLPDRFSELLRPEIQDRMKSIWNVGCINGSTCMYKCIGPSN